MDSGAYVYETWNDTEPSMVGISDLTNYTFPLITLDGDDPVQFAPFPYLSLISSLMIATVILRKRRN